jgi:hypothetical protein
VTAKRASRRKTLALAGVALIAGIAVLVLREPRPPPPAPVLAASMPVPPLAPAPVTAAEQPNAAVAPVAAPAPSAAAQVRLQARLDAMALAYEEGDARAMELALWPNHAVVRPDGELLDRAALLATWAQEWQAFQNRSLDFYVESIRESGDGTVATWTLLLTADVPDSAGDLQHIMITGKQQATLLGSGDGERLQGPITYLGFERAYNGFPWPLDEAEPPAAPRTGTARP